jgi:hypothetical protein
MRCGVSSAGRREVWQVGILDCLYICVLLRWVCGVTKLYATWIYCTSQSACGEYMVRTCYTEHDMIIVYFNVFSFLLHLRFVPTPPPPGSISNKPFVTDYTSS